MSENDNDTPAEEPKAEKKTHEITLTIIESHYEKLGSLVLAERAKKDLKKPITEEQRQAVALKAFKKGLSKASVEKVPTVVWE